MAFSCICLAMLQNGARYRPVYKEKTHGKFTHACSSKIIHSSARGSSNTAQCRSSNPAMWHTECTAHKAAAFVFPAPLFCGLPTSGPLFAGALAKTHSKYYPGRAYGRSTAHQFVHVAWRLLSIGNVPVLRFAEWPLPCTYYGRECC